MLTLDRRKQMLHLINKNKVATVSELAKKFNVHEATIRRDLALLEKNEQVERTYGGVVKKDEVHSEPPFHERESVQFEAKKRMGRCAGDFVEDGDNIIIDSGTTTVHIVESIYNKNITTVTNDINIATKLRYSHRNKVIVSGGALFPESYMLNGHLTDETLKKLSVHTAFIGTPAFHPEAGLSHFDDYLVSAKKEMIQSAKQVIVIADHTKIGKVSLYNVAGIHEVDALITTKRIGEKQKKMLEKSTVKVYTV